MTTLLRVLFRRFEPAPTVENFGARITVGEPVQDDQQREQRLNEALDKTASR